MLIFGGFIDSTALSAWSLTSVCQKSPGNTGSTKGRILVSQRFKLEKNVWLKAELERLQYNTHFIHSGVNAAKQW